MLYADLLKWQKEYKLTRIRFDEIQGLSRGNIEMGFIAALNDFRDNLLGGAFADISDTDLAKYLDDIYDTYDSDGNLRNVCNIITVLK